MKKFIPQTSMLLILVFAMSSCNTSRLEKDKNEANDSLKITVNDSREVINEKENISKEDSILNSQFEDRKWAMAFLQDSIVLIDSLKKDFDSCCISECESWKYPKKDELAYVIEKMYWDHPMEITEVYDTYKCELKGYIKTKLNKEYTFYLNAGGYVHIYGENVNFYLGCQDTTIKNYFLKIKPTTEEFRKMMESE